VKVRFLPSASAELAAVRAYYNGKRRGLGAEFSREVRAALARIRSAPLACPKVPDAPNARRALLERFPYCVVFYVDGKTVFIVAVAHMSRRPGYWRGR
jgi:plasmid stabilization system protein ParE